MELLINGQKRQIDDAAAPLEMPLLWLLRDVLNLTGTKFGCGVAACGACTVHLDGQAVRSCVLPISAVQGKAVRLSEGRVVETGTPEELWSREQSDFRRLMLSGFESASEGAR